MAIAPTNPSATNVLVTSMGSLLFLFLCPQVNEGRSALVPMEQEAVFFCLFCACSDGTSKEAVFFCLFCACSDGTSKEAVFFCLFSVSIFRFFRSRFRCARSLLWGKN